MAASNQGHAPVSPIKIRTCMMFAYRDIVARCYAAGAELVQNHAVIGVSKGATRAEIERDIDKVLDGGGTCSKSA